MISVPVWLLVLLSWGWVLLVAAVLFFSFAMQQAKK